MIQFTWILHLFSTIADLNMSCIRRFTRPQGCTWKVGLSVSCCFGYHCNLLSLVLFSLTIAYRCGSNRARMVAYILTQLMQVKRASWISSSILRWRARHRHVLRNRHIRPSCVAHSTHQRRVSRCRHQVQTFRGGPAVWKSVWSIGSIYRQTANQASHSTQALGQVTT